jgi:hypothetical protein
MTCGNENQHIITWPKIEHFFVLMNFSYHFFAFGFIISKVTLRATCTIKLDHNINHKTTF